MASYTIDFVTVFSRTSRGCDAIWAVVERLTKAAHILSIWNNYSKDKLAQVYHHEIVRLHGMPETIVSDRDPQFRLRFWKGLSEAMGTKLQPSTMAHSQADGQSERTI